MRSTLLASCLLGLSFLVVGCDDAKNTPPPADTPVVKPNPEPKDDAPKGGMMEAPKGAMEAAPKADMPAPATTEPAAEPKKEEMPKS